VHQHRPPRATSSWAYGMEAHYKYQGENWPVSGVVGAGCGWYRLRSEMAVLSRDGDGAVRFGPGTEQLPPGTSRWLIDSGTGTNSRGNHFCRFNPERNVSGGAGFLGLTPTICLGRF